MAEEPLKVVLLGNSGVGKSNLIARFHSNEFSTEFMSTMGVEFVTKKMDVDGVPVKLQIWDTAGQERYASMMKTYYRKAKGALLVYDVTSRASFEGLETWRKNLEANADPNCVCMVCGNKSDMTERTVDPKEGEAYAAKYGMGFSSTSALSGSNVELVFVEMARRILEKSANPGAGGSTSGGGGMKLKSGSATPSSKGMDCC